MTVNSHEAIGFEEALTTFEVNQLNRVLVAFTAPGALTENATNFANASTHSFQTSINP